jgi:hypothetical protein
MTGVFNTQTRSKMKQPSGNLQGVNVYKYLTTTSDIYRISIDILTNFTTLLTSGKARLATSDSLQCPLANCMFELATDQRISDSKFSILRFFSQHSIL